MPHVAIIIGGDGRVHRRGIDAWRGGDRQREELKTLAVSASSPHHAGGALCAPLKPTYLTFAALYAIACACALHPPDASVVAGGGLSPLAAREI